MHFNLYVRKMHENLIINLGLKVFVRKKKKKKKKVINSIIRVVMLIYILPRVFD